MNNRYPSDSQKRAKSIPAMKFAQDEPLLQTQSPPVRRKRTRVRSLNLQASKKSLPRLNMTEFCEYSTLHGIYDIYRARHCCIRCFWVVIFISALFAAVYGCYAILHEFLQRPVVVSYFVTRNDTLTLPDLVICPINRFNRTYLESFNISSNLGQYLELSFWGFGVKNFHQETKDWEDLIMNEISDELDAELDDILYKHNITFGDFFRDSGLDCSALISFPKDVGNKILDNCHLFETLMTSAGKCWRIPGKVQAASGYGYGLTTMITIPSNQFHPGMNNLPSSGVVLKLVEHGKGIDYDLSFVPVGSHAIMPLRATSYQFINDPPRYECIPVEKLPESYSRVACWDQCVIAPAEDHCNCSPPAASNPRKRICTPREFFKCLVPTFGKLFHNQMKMCNLKCKPSCSYWQYQTTMTYTQFPSPEAKVFIKNETQYEHMRTHQIVLEYFYQNLEYTLIEHVPAMTIDSFIAQLGGQVSLWVGGSILTVVQLLIFLVQVLYNRCVEVPTAALRNRRAFLAQNSQSLLSNTAFVGLLQPVDSVKMDNPPVTNECPIVSRSKTGEMQLAAHHLHSPVYSMSRMNQPRENNNNFNCLDSRTFSPESEGDHSPRLKHSRNHKFMRNGDIGVRDAITLSASNLPTNKEALV